MIYSALVFFVISMIACFFGFITAEPDTAILSKFLFFVFMCLTALVLIFATFGLGQFS